MVLVGNRVKKNNNNAGLKLAASNNSDKWVLFFTLWQRNPDGLKEDV